MAQLIEGLSSERIHANLKQIRHEIAKAARISGRDPQSVQILAAIKYIAGEDLPKLAQAGIELVGENRSAELNAKFALHGPLFVWDFIGQLQSRKVREILPHVRLIHSLASESALSQLILHRDLAHPQLGVLIQVNVSGEQGKAGVDASQIDSLIERSPVPVRGLMTMPPHTEDGEKNRRFFARLRELAEDRGLTELSMGTTQDYQVAVQEGATIVRIGTKLYA